MIQKNLFGELQNIVSKKVRNVKKICYSCKLSALNDKKNLIKRLLFLVMKKKIKVISQIYFALSRTFFNCTKKHL